MTTEDGKLKNAALLLFAKNPRRYFTCVEFKIGRFRRSIADLIIQDVIEGNIIQVWDNYVEIQNEGGLPVGYTPDTLMNKHSSRPRNKNVANSFFKAGFIESWGRGYEKIFEGFKAA